MVKQHRAWIASLMCLVGPATALGQPEQEAAPAEADRPAAPEPTAPEPTAPEPSTAEPAAPEPSTAEPTASEYDAEPSQMIYEPPPPEARRRRSPRTALWAGVRAGVFVPFGTLWYDAVLVDPFIDYRPRQWQDYASLGPMLEADVGVRLGRRYILFALWERALLGAGDLQEDDFGGQEHGDTNLYGMGFRFSTDPDDIGFLLEAVLGYRDFTAEWEDGTELELRDGWLETRLGIGADIRLWRYFTLSPLVTLSSGVFDEAEWEGRFDDQDPRDTVDLTGRYNSVTLHVGGHFDIY